MARLYGVCLGLLLFSAIILSGMLAGNSAERVVSRAVLGLLGGFVLGTTAGWIGVWIVRDNIPAYGGDGAEASGQSAESKTPETVSAKN